MLLYLPETASPEVPLHPPFSCPSASRHWWGNVRLHSTSGLRKRGVHQFVDVELHLVSRVGRHVDDSGVHADGVFRACLDAVSAVDADPEVDVEADRVLLDVGVGMLPGHDGDALRRADGLAQHAAHAARRPIVSDGQPVAAPESERERPRLFGILEGDRRPEVREQPHAVRRVEKQIPEEVRRGDLEAAEDLRNVELFPDRQLTPANRP